jgi:hypothetical protein
VVRSSRERPRVEGNGTAPTPEAEAVLRPQTESIATNNEPEAAPAPAAPAAPTPLPAPVAEEPRPEQAPASTELTVAAHGTAVPDSRASAAPAPSSHSFQHMFESIAINPDGPTMAIPEAPERRTAHLGYRVTESYLAEVRRRTLMLAAMHDMTVEMVNLFALQEFGASWDRVNDRIVQYRAMQARRASGSR